MTTEQSSQKDLASQLSSPGAPFMIYDNIVGNTEGTPATFPRSSGKVHETKRVFLPLLCWKLSSFSFLCRK